MKKLLLLLLLIPIYTSAQESDYVPNIQVDSASRKIDFKGVVQVDGVSKEKIFMRARDWFTREFEVAKAIVVMDDISSGHLTARGNYFGNRKRGIITVNFPYGVTFTVDLHIKNGKYKYEITDFVEIDGLNGQGLPDMHPSDRYVFDPKYRNKNGEFDSTAKERLYYVEGNANNIIVQLKAALATDKFDHPVESDF
ncbi:MAG TPA: DUF4468 domain-containing protein [Mucilaginibacter sp.]|nr:DUF4468 domain-containing protein [Mucilaginibacter sp.]